METWGATDRYWAVTRIRTRDMCVQFHSVVGRLPVRGDFVVRLRYQGRRYVYWYYFYDSFEDALVRAPRYDGMTNAVGDQRQQMALEYARAHVNEF